MKFTLEIELGNEAMADYCDIEKAITSLCLASTQSANDGDSGVIRDRNGNTIGKWEVTDEEAAAASIQDQIEYALKSAERTYTQAHSGKQITWNPMLTELDRTGRNGHFYVVIGLYPSKLGKDGSLSRLTLESGSVSVYLRSREKAKAYFKSLLMRFPGFDWTGANPRIVKAYCACDAHTDGVLVANLCPDCCGEYDAAKGSCGCHDNGAQ